MEDFDKLIKNIMETGEEPVPASLWDAVQSQLPAPKTSKTPVILLWTRRAGIALAAAAAVAAGVVIANRQPSETQVEIVENSGRVVADLNTILEPEDGPVAIQEDEFNFVPQSVTPQTTKPQATKAQSVERKKAVASLEKKSEPAEQKVDTAAAKKADIATEHKAEQSIKDTPTNNYTNTPDPFAEMERGRGITGRKKVGTALTFYGNAASNTNPNGKGAYGPMKVAAATPSSTGITETGESSYMIPLSFGTGVKFMFNDRWSLGVGVDCSYLTRTYAGTYRKIGSQGDILIQESYSDIRNNQVYIGIPVNAYFSIISNKFVDFYAYGGATLEQCISNKHIMHASDGNNYFKASNGTPLLSTGLGLGCEFIVADHLGIYVDPSARYYFKTKNTPKSIRTQQPFMAGIEIGLRVRL